MLCVHVKTSMEVLCVDVKTNKHSFGSSFRMLAVILFQIFSFLHQTGRFIQNWMVYTKLEGLNQTGWFIQSWRVYTKLEGLHQTGVFTPNWRVYTKLGLHQIGRSTQNWSVYTNLEGLHQTGGFTQHWRICNTKLEDLHKPGNWRVYTKLEGLPKPVAFIAAVKMTRVTAFNLCPTKLEGLPKPVAVIAAVSNGKSHSPHSTSAPQNWRVYTVTSGQPCCSHFCTSPAITD